MKPAVLCKLGKGKLIDTFHGFVDTFNYLVDFIENLKGDGESDASMGVVVDRSVPDHPVIRIKDDFTSGQSTIKVIGTDGSYALVGDPDAEEFKTLTFATKSDANIKVSVTGDSDGNATISIGAYYK